MSDNKANSTFRFLYNGQQSLLLPASEEAFAQLKDWLIDVLKQLHIVPREGKQFIIAADEIFSNIVGYAYTDEDSRKDVEVSLLFDRDRLMLSMVFADRGMAFNPLAKDAELPTERIRNRMPGGIGLFLVHQFMDELNYRREQSRNVLTISKVVHLEAAEQGTFSC